MVEGAGEPSPMLDKIMEIRGKIINWNKVPAKPPQIGARVLGEMRDMFRKDVTRLSELVERDLSHWLDRLGALHLAAFAVGGDGDIHLASGAAGRGRP